VTDWRRSFRSALFGAWRAAGLPSPEAFERAYEELRDQAGPPAVPREAARGPLDPVTIRSVHGFGHAIGTVCADLLAVDGHAREASVSWCGRFNLGISLIDWLCDEAAVPPSAIACLPAFARLTATRRRGPPPTHDAAVFLDGLAHELLVELADDVGPPRRREPRSALWPTLRRMLRAELALAGPGFFGPEAPPSALTLLRLKSVEPFRVMAERTLAGACASPRDTRVKAARRIGRAIGECVWLVDDADDLWRDLDARHGNRFIAAAVAADDRVVASDDTTLVDIAIVRVLRRERTAERLCSRAVNRLRAAVRTAPCEPRAQERAAGLVGAALARWAG
jgi:hypothetical protein